MKLLTVTITQRVETVGLLFAMSAVVVTTLSLASGLIRVVLPPELVTVIALANNLAAWTRVGLVVVLPAWVIARREAE